MGKINAYDALRSTDCKLRNMALVYLSNDYSVSNSTLSEICGLALSTIRTYLRKFGSLLEEARKVFNKVKKHIKRKITSTTRFFCYIDKITMPNGDIWTKIGQTTQNPEKRASQFSWKENKETIKPTKVEVLHVIECKDETSMTNMEDLLRIGMTSINPKAYKKNDRLLEYQEGYCDTILNNRYVQMGLSDYALAA